MAITTTSKLFQHFILFHRKPFLSTNDHQFGFKRGTGTDMSIFLLKQIISSYLQQGSPIFSVFLDASKAFDRVSHELLFEKLLLRDVPRVLYDCCDIGIVNSKCERGEDLNCLNLLESQ